VGLRPFVKGRKKPLTRKEASVLELHFLGFSMPEIDDILGYSPKISNSFLTNIQKKWGVSREELLKEAVRLGYF
jgi:DNA-binding CsgD family transcriptional regulator